MSTINEIKLIVLGNTSVGKSSFILKYIEDKFVLNYIATLGMDFKQKKLKLKNGQEVRLRIYDTAGQERFKSVAISFIKKAEGVILIYDIGNKATFESLEEWIKNIKESGKENLPIILVGNKCDLPPEKRQVELIEGKDKAEEFNLPFFETSCKEGINIKEVFEKIVEDITGKNNLSSGGEFKILNKSKSKGKCC
jgi:small GTP-binding protein